MKKQHRKQLAGVWASVAAAAIALNLGAGAAQAAVTVGSTAPDFNVRNHSTGQPLRLYNYQGNILLVDFWAYWCGPCMSAAADIEPNVVEYYRSKGGECEWRAGAGDQRERRYERPGRREQLYPDLRFGADRG